jgi:hypothetical protein
MSVNTLIKLVDIPDYRFDPNCESLDYGDIATDCETKTISLIEAMQHIGCSIFEMTDGDAVNKDKIHNLSALIMDLADIAIATNKISTASNFLSGLKIGEKK